MIRSCGTLGHCIIAIHYEQQISIIKNTTFSDGSLGSHTDEERSKLR